MLSWLLVESLERRWLLEDSLVELEVVVVGDLESRVMKEWYIVKGLWLEGLINLRVGLSHQQFVLSSEREEMEEVLGWCYELLAMQQQHKDQVVRVSEVKMKLGLKVIWESFILEVHCKEMVV
ncbi:hypothetical protein Tco_1197201 [Tanacetum coccineum]